MPFLGFVQEKDLESFEKDKLGKLIKRVERLSSSSDTRIQNVDDGMDVVKEKIDSISLDVEANSMSIKSLNESSKNECTKIINGIHICNKPLYENVKKPSEVTYKDLAKGSDLCIGVENVLDVFPTEFEEIPGFKRFWSSRDSDVPNNFVCIEGKKGKNYVDTLVKKDIVKYISEKGDKYPLIDFHGRVTPNDIINPKCREVCKRYECKELDDNRENVYKKEKEFCDGVGDRYRNRIEEIHADKPELDEQDERAIREANDSFTRESIKCQDFRYYGYDGISSSQCLGCGESSDFKCNLKTM